METICGYIFTTTKVAVVETVIELVAVRVIVGVYMYTAVSYASHKNCVNIWLPIIAVIAIHDNYVTC